MAKAVGVVLGAGLMAAGYQVAYEETRTFIHSLRVGASDRRNRNDAMMLALMNTKLPLVTQESIRRSRDTVEMCKRLMTNPALPPDQHLMILGALTTVLTRASAVD